MVSSPKRTKLYKKSIHKQKRTRQPSLAIPRGTSVSKEKNVRNKRLQKTTSETAVFKTFVHERKEEKSQTRKQTGRTRAASIRLCSGTPREPALSGGWNSNVVRHSSHDVVVLEPPPPGCVQEPCKSLPFQAARTQTGPFIQARVEATGIP